MTKREVVAMKTYDILRFGFNSLTQRKLRSWLTILGIIIGVASLVALLSIGQGAQEQVASRLGSLGADMITISSGFQRAGGGGFGGGFEGFGGGSRTTANLTEDDVRVVKSTAGVLYVNGIVSGRGNLVYLGEKTDISIQGIDTSVWRFMETTELESGRYLNSGDTNSVVIGTRIANEMFSQTISVNRQVTIEGKAFTVVGILKSSSSGQQDNVVYMSKEMARDILELDSKKISSISIKVLDSSQVEEIANKTAEKLRITRHVQADKQDFTVTTAQAMQSQISSITGTFSLFLAAIAGISLLVGAIGISNTMFTSVMERTRQIGILKSVGATDKEIMKIFISEAAFIGLFGGIMGVLFGITAAGIISEMGVRIGFQGAFNASVKLDLIIFAILFSTIIGAVSGFIPAKRAANLQPVEALRYE